MRISTTAERLGILMSERNLKQVDVLRLAQPFCREHHIKLGRSDLSQFVNGKTEPGQSKLSILSMALNVSEAWLMGFDVPREREKPVCSHSPFPAPTVTEDVVTFPVLGDVAAGYDHVALESWEGDTVDIPRSYLRGHLESEYMVLRVCGDSMYPFYLEGDRVLILRTPTLEYSGQIGCVRYDGENATLKRVEYVEGENRMKLVPLNPMHPPRIIEGADLEQCSILGIPRLLIRDLND